LRDSSSTTLPTRCVWVPRHVAQLVVDYLVASRCSSHSSSCHSSSTTPPRKGSSSTTSPMPRVQVPRHVVRLVVDYFAYATRPSALARRAARRRLLGCVARLVVWLISPLVVDYFASAARPGASAHRAARLVALCRLLRLARLVVDYFTYAARPGASARRAARCRLLLLRRASRCLGTSRGSSSTTSPTPRVRVPRHVVRLVVDYFASRRLVIDYFAYAMRPGILARGAGRLAARHRLLRLRRASGCLNTSRGSSHHLSSTTSPTPRVRVPRHVARLIT
jgi:hypothetical protein